MARSLYRQGEAARDRIAGIDVRNQVFSPQTPLLAGLLYFRTVKEMLGRNPGADSVLRSYRSLTRSRDALLTPFGASQAAE